MDGDFELPNFSLGLTQILDDGFGAPDDVVNDDAELNKLEGALNVQVRDGHFLQKLLFIFVLFKLI